jgi:hypothetical protein
MIPIFFFFLSLAPVSLPETIVSPHALTRCHTPPKGEDLCDEILPSNEGSMAEANLGNVTLCHTRSGSGIAIAPSLEGKRSSRDLHPLAERGIKPIFDSLFKPAIYFGAGTFFGSAALLGGIGWGTCQLFPWKATAGNELLISSELLGTASFYCFAQAFKSSPFFSFLFKKIPSSYSAWNQNHQMLSQIPAASDEDRELVNFLKQRWLAKMTGCYPFLINWMCPAFGIPFQIHPESTNSYARDPATKFSETYVNRVKAWKKLLAHPPSFPLILTRPANINDHLPSYVEILQKEDTDYSAQKIAKAIQTQNSLAIVDLTSILPSGTCDPKSWLEEWQACEKQLAKACKRHQIDTSCVLCIHRVLQKEIGGIRLLPLSSHSKETTEQQCQFLIEWISRFGLTANRVELDRLLFTSSLEQSSPAFPQVHFRTREEWVAILNTIENNWKSDHPQKKLMVKGTLQILRSLCTVLPEKKWEGIMASDTRSAIVQLCLNKIKHQLESLCLEEEKASFQDVALCIEQVHADLTSLLEIFTPFTDADFSAIYRHHLTSIPKELQPLTRYGIHASAMTSLGGIFKATEKSVGRSPRVLFGENAYFECIHASERVSHAKAIADAEEGDWKEVDLLLLQFNPTVKRINFKVTEYQATEYHVEKIADILHRALKARGTKPLSIALDCTLDYSNSNRVGLLLSEFQKEIERGDLNIMCYRSGLKFDLFGMDNYCGAPFFMFHNQDSKWSFYDTLLADPTLHTDRLSLNWFCLAFEYATVYLEAYRKQIFDNTRALMQKIPSRLYNKTNPYYRVIPIDSDVDPSFIDIKIFGPWHKLRGEFLVGAFLTLKCMEAGYPLLFRPGIGFYHPNLAVLFGKECTTVRLTLGLDPTQIDVILRCLEKIDACNGPYTELQ